MKKSRFSETQIISMLKEVDAGMKVDMLCRKHSISTATYYKWKSQYGGLEASDVKRMKALEDENNRLKRMFADLSLENTALKSLIEKKAGDSRQARGSDGVVCRGFSHQTRVPTTCIKPSPLLPHAQGLAHQGC